MRSRCATSSSTQGTAWACSRATSCNTHPPTPHPGVDKLPGLLRHPGRATPRRPLAHTIAFGRTLP
eukprot:2324515-Pyramimonas_sp.AAC.1